MKWVEDTEAGKDWLMTFAQTFGIKEVLNIRNIHVWFSESNLTVFYAEDNTPKWSWLKHLSVSKNNRYPTWDEIIMVKERFMGNIDTMMVIPKKEDYINVHEYCFHIWEIPGGWGLR